MADKSRSIQTKFWYDTWIETLNMSEKLLYLYLLTNPLTNLLGIYEISLKRISDESGIAKDAVRKGLKRFEEDSRVYFINNNYIILPNFLKNQSLNTNMQRGVEKLFSLLPKSIKNNIIDKGSESFERIRNGLGKYEIEMEIEMESKTEDGYYKIKEEKELLFKEAWNLYDKKEDRKKALQIWMNLTLSDINFCIEVIPKYVKSTPDKQFRKMFKTYLNNRSWENEIDLNKSKLEIIGYMYDCYHCRKQYKFKKSGTYRCKENDCQVEMRSEGENEQIIGAKLSLIKTLYKEYNGTK